MRLDEYLRRNGLTSAQFADAAGIRHKQTVHNYRHGLRFPSPDNLRSIEQATSGLVTPKDFLEHHAERASVIQPRPAPQAQVTRSDVAA